MAPRLVLVLVSSISLLRNSAGEEFMSRMPSAFRKHRSSVAFSVRYQDGRTAYLFLEGHGGPERDFLVSPIAHERQRKGQLPEGIIVALRRVH